MTTTSGHTLWRHAGTLIVATGLLHVVVFVLMSLGAVADIAQAGIVDTIGRHEDRAVFWFGGIMAGAGLVLLGLLATSWIRATGRPAPRYIGWSLVALGICTTVLDPVSGGVLVVAVGLVALSGPRRRSAQHDAQSQYETSPVPDDAATSRAFTIPSSES